MCSPPEKDSFVKSAVAPSAPGEGSSSQASPSRLLLFPCLDHGIDLVQVLTSVTDPKRTRETVPRLETRQPTTLEAVLIETKLVRGKKLVSSPIAILMSRGLLFLAMRSPSFKDPGSFASRDATKTIS